MKKFGMLSVSSDGALAVNWQFSESVSQPINHQPPPPEDLPFSSGGEVTTMYSSLSPTRDERNL